MANSRKLRFAWLVIPVALGAGTLYWVLAPGADHGAQVRSSRVKAPSAEEQSHLSQVVAVMRGDKADRNRRLVDLYVDWAGQPDKLAGRKAALDGLFAERNMARKLSSVLEALEADPTPPEEDPLWSHAVEALSALWTPEQASKGLELMHTETRPRAQRAVISSFAELAMSDRVKALDETQVQTLKDSFIDRFQKTPASQQPEIETALRHVAGNDVADILLGKGLTNDDDLEINRSYKRELAAVTHSIGQGRAPGPEPSEEEPR